MEKLPNFVINGGVKMPVGYRFHPTDEELVVHYLKRKVHASPLPASIIPDFDVFHTLPWGLPGDVREKRRYFFYNHQMNVNNERDSKLILGKTKSKRAAGGCGYWKHIGKEKQIVASETNQAVGIRKTLVFCQRKHPNYHGTKTRWFMHEYRLLASDQPNPTHQEYKTELGNWVVCSVLQKKRKPQRSDIGVVSHHLNRKRTRSDQRADQVENNTFMSSAGLSSSCPFTASSSSCCSDITELSPNSNGGLDNDDDQEENSSTANIAIVDQSYS